MQKKKKHNEQPYKPHFRLILDHFWGILFSNKSSSVMHNFISVSSIIAKFTKNNDQIPRRLLSDRRKD